jgi:SET domain-containing protein
VNEGGRTRVFIYAKRKLTRGEELFYDYGLIIDDKITRKLKKEYLCLCGTKQCRGTMLKSTRD